MMNKPKGRPRQTPTRVIRIPDKMDDYINAIAQNTKRTKREIINLIWEHLQKQFLPK